MSSYRRIAKNAFANLLRGSSTTIVGLFLPAILVRHMSQADYSVWVLILQVAAYCIYLELGLQTAVGRYIAIAAAKGDAEEADAVYSTVLVGLTAAAAAATVLMIAAAYAAPSIFPSIPPGSLLPMRAALLLVGISVAAGLPSFAWTGIFIGLERNEFIALISGGAKLLSGGVIAIAAIHGASLVAMASLVAAVNLFSYLLLYVFAKRVSAAVFRLHLVRKAIARELFSYCSSLMVWNFSMLMINGLDLALVGHFQFAALAPFAIATALVNTISGMQNAIFNAAMPHAAVLHARKDFAVLGKLVITYTQLGVVLLLLVCMPLLIYAVPILRMWVGAQYVAQGHTLLSILVLANIVRLIATPYAVVLVASGQQRRVKLSPLMEGFTNLLASILLGSRFGALGVATGTLVGSVVGLLGHLLYNMPRTAEHIQLRSRDFFFSGVGLPVLANGLLILLAVRSRSEALPSVPLFALALMVTLVLSLSLVFRAGFGKRISGLAAQSREAEQVMRVR